MSKVLSHYLREFRAGRDLAAQDTTKFMDALIASKDVSLLAEILIAWADKNATEDEIYNLASLMRSRMRRLEHRYPSVIDIVGTGGSPMKTFNVSTAAAFVVAGAGVPVAKHGNRAATSRSGSADVLEHLGIRPDIPPDAAQTCLDELGICFMFAPQYHSLSPELAQARRKAGRPTIFNIIGPMCNPARAEHQLIGVWDASLVEKVANVLARLGAKRSWVVHSKTGLDEIARKGETYIADVTNDGVDLGQISAADFGTFNGHGTVPDRLDAVESAALIRKILANKRRGSNSEKLVLMNAAAAIFIAGKAPSLPHAFAQATASVATGAALAKLTRLAKATNE